MSPIVGEDVQLLSRPKHSINVESKAQALQVYSCNVRLLAGPGAGEIYGRFALPSRKLDFLVRFLCPNQHLLMDSPRRLTSQSNCEERTLNSGLVPRG
jgi:hypothetical protein